ncbi:tyrosine-type recombinase/integrase [Paludibacterium denitrificans]|uniref:Tyrosine-type recombinase/integrase n=1 Tax=Paludibacterium denitrificans TaxID=2675226 RepID=A0A844GCQ8_9NEIS|nr:tyrosine-type recombinase/integrase [Paludibacterium denitrificans]MTD33429.1 tyrosine-type recombinase/integrase [Paludibacterium denitrificans]
MSFENLERIGETYYASMHVPPDVREALGKRRLRKSLRTKDKRTAIHRARLVIDQWWSEIHAARKSLTNTPDQQTLDALAWREELFALASDPDQQEALEYRLSDVAEKIEQKAGIEAAQTFYGIATGKVTPVHPLIEKWKAYSAKSVKPKTLAMYAADVERMAEKIETLEDFTKGGVRAWLWGLAEVTAGGLAEATQRRILNGLSNFWRWCHAQGLIDEDASNPTIGVALHKGAGPKIQRIPFTAVQIVDLWKKAVSKGDPALADLIYLGAYTGARIEELCSLTCSDISPDWRFFTVRDAKTSAGNRDVPIHSKLLPVIRRLCNESKDDFLIPSTAKNSHGKRSDPLGKRFGRLKDELGHGPERVFHSIRKTVATMLENAGVSEGVAADILGHEKSTITYGLYSGGTSIENKTKAIENLKYSW